MAENFTVDRPLAGGAKNYLDDIRALNAGIPKEMERGVREGYLEAEKVKGLATRLGVAEPRIKRRMWVYVEHRQIQSMAVEAYDEEDAIQIFNESFGHEIRTGNVPYGFRRSHWDSDPVNRARGIIISEPTTKRPTMNHNLRFHVGRELMDLTTA